MYVLDANVFIQSHRAHYGLDFVPAFWQWIERTFLAGQLVSIVPIRDEIAAGEDDLADWAKAHPRLFVSMDQACAPSLGTLAGWVLDAGYTDAASQEFLSVADYQLVAYAHAHQSTVVTMERSEPKRRSKVKIPDACAALSVDCTTPFDMLRQEGACFVLGD
ncbi:DUF4411 family protein [Clavibacter capsici]|uniref:DUF4411 family protein n=1 Tax=Clavibacter capsici TaxID=1874630 RepID=A0AAE6XTN7_9MICO|nr:DUF4411 family protein [Clavibacter capsici]ALD14066.1 hypothetical protein AES38_02970 [Clavibacter capsici]QIS46261.1 DUF4411 family protein [Clavibacter capsici]